MQFEPKEYNSTPAKVSENPYRVVVVVLGFPFMKLQHFINLLVSFGIALEGY